MENITAKINLLQFFKKIQSRKVLKGRLTFGVTAVDQLYVIRLSVKLVTDVDNLEQVVDPNIRVKLSLSLRPPRFQKYECNNICFTLFIILMINQWVVSTRTVRYLHGTPPP